MATELIVPTSIIASTNLDVSGGVAAIDEEIDPSWAPSDIASATLVGWFDADNVSLSGSEITQANDLSGSGNHAVQATSTHRPTLGNDAHGNYIDFSGSLDHHFDIPNLFNGTMARSVFAYLEPGSGTEDIFYTCGGISSQDVSGTHWRFRRSTGVLRIEILNSGYTSSLTTGSALGMVGCTFDGTQLQHHTLWLNGSSAAATGTNSVNTANIGQTIGPVTNILGNPTASGKLREKVVCQGKISDAEIGQLLTYFQARWGVP